MKTLSRSTIIEYDKKKITIINNEGYRIEDVDCRMIMEDFDNGVFFDFWIEILVDTDDYMDCEWVKVPTSKFRMDLDVDYEDEDGNTHYYTEQDMYDEVDMRFNNFNFLDLSGRGLAA